MVKHICLGTVLLLSANLSFAAQDPTAPLDWAHPAKAPVPHNTVHKKGHVIHHYRLPRLDSIICQSGQGCYAILNEHIVTQGQRYHRYDIAEINQEFVTLKRGNRHWKLELFRLDVKK